MSHPDLEPPSADERFANAIAEWRSRHRLRDEDPVLLLLELFLIHQARWDEFRRREMPSFDGVNGQITKLLESNRDVAARFESLAGLLRSAQRTAGDPVVNRTVAWTAWLAATLAGYLLGRVWP
jgi:hypothetical protein